MLVSLSNKCLATPKAVQVNLSEAWLVVGENRQKDVVRRGIA